LGTAFKLQVLKGKYYYESSNKNRFRVYIVYPQRGEIFDRDGNKLATNRPSFDLFLTPYYFFHDYKGSIENHPTFRFLVKRLHLDPEELKEKLRRYKRRPFAQLLIKKDLSEKEMALINAMSWQLPGIYIDPSWTRTYPYANLFAHVVGYVGEATEEQVAKEERYPGEFVGKTGLELQYDDELRGIGGWEKWEVDALGHRIRRVEKSIPLKGSDLVTTLVLPLQKKAAELFEGKAGEMSISAAITE
jgi:penicillin-binding protein 2